MSDLNCPTPECPGKITWDGQSQDGMILYYSCYPNPKFFCGKSFKLVISEIESMRQEAMKDRRAILGHRQMHKNPIQAERNYIGDDTKIEVHDDLMNSLQSALDMIGKAVLNVGVDLPQFMKDHAVVHAHPPESAPDEAKDRYMEARAKAKGLDIDLDALYKIIATYSFIDLGCEDGG